MSSSLEFLAFEIAGRAYGFPTRCIREVIPRAPVTAVPDVPPFLLGVTNLRHEVIPVIDLRLLLEEDRPSVIDDRSCFVITMMKSRAGPPTPVGFVVERIADRYRMEADQMDPAPSIGGRAQSTAVTAMARTIDGVKIMIDPDKLFEAHGESIQRVADTAEPTEAGEHQGRQTTGDTPRVKLLSIHIGATEVAFPVSEIKKIIPLEGVEEDNLAPDTLCGAMTLEGQRLGIVDLAKRLALNSDVASKRKSIVVADHDGLPVGYAIDRIGDLHDINASEIRASRSLNDLVPAHSHSLGFLELESRALEVLSFAKILPPKELAAIKSWKGVEERVLHTNTLTKTTNADARVDPQLRHLAGSYLIVRVGAHLMGIPASAADEVVPLEALLRVPMTKRDFAGALLLRNKTYSVMDLRRHLDLPDVNNNDDRPTIVLVRTPDDHVGLIVQHVVQLAKIQPAQISPASEAAIEIHENLLLGSAELDTDHIALLDILAILADDEESLLGKWEDFQQDMRDANPDFDSASILSKPKKVSG